jgi:hypothetical protein
MPELPDWMDKDYNIIDDQDPEAWFTVSAFLHNASLPDSDVNYRLMESEILFLQAAAAFCEEIGLYYQDH